MKVSDLTIKNLNIMVDFENKILNISQNKLTSLEGSPKSVKKFPCCCNDLKNLKGSPKMVEDYFKCINNKIETLEGISEEIKGNLYCQMNNLKNLIGLKKIGGGIYCSNNGMTSLEGRPKIVRGDFDCSFNNITTLKDRPKKIHGVFSCMFNNVKNQKNEIIKYKIKAKSYHTNDGEFTFEDIKDEFFDDKTFLIS